MPVTNIGEYTFSYPTGISDLKNFDLDSFKKINFFYYIGSTDKSDPAIPDFETAFYEELDNILGTGNVVVRFE